jgi:hypothetical protein
MLDIVLKQKEQKKPQNKIGVGGGGKGYVSHRGREIAIYRAE